jgi:hypothetical protein
MSIPAGAETVHYELSLTGNDLPYVDAYIDAPIRGDAPDDGEYSHQALQAGADAILAYMQSEYGELEGFEYVQTRRYYRGTIEGDTWPTP